MLTPIQNMINMRLFHLLTEYMKFVKVISDNDNEIDAFEESLAILTKSLSD